MSQTSIATAPAVSTREAETLTGRLSSAGLLTLLIGAFLPMTDFFIVNVALPTIDTDLRASGGMLQLVVAGYAVAYAVLLVVGGRVGDALGRRRMFIGGMAAFTLTSLLCGLAPDAGTLVAARLAQGAASAMMFPQVLSTIQATASGERRSRALGYYGATGGIAVVVGQLAGGLLVSANLAGTSWRPIFLVNVPVGLLGLVLARRTLPETRSAFPAAVDVAGTSLLGATLCCLLVPLTEGRALGWPLWTLAMLAASPLTAAGFIVAERRVERRGAMPLVPMAVVRLPSVRRGLSVAIPFFAGFGAFMFVYALVAQEGARLGALTTGLTLVPMAVSFLVASVSMPRLVARYGRSVLTAGAGIQLIGMLSLATALLTGWPHPAPWALAVGSLVCGAGQGLVMTPLFRIVLSEVPRQLAGVGSGVLATTQQTALALGVATLGSLYLDVSPANRLGDPGAAVIVLLAISAIAVIVACASRALPDGSAGR